MVTRRQALALGASMPFAPLAWGRPASRTAQHLFAAWNDAGTSRVGVLAIDARRATVLASIAVPTRAHGIAVLAPDELVVVARRPGDWMLRARLRGAGRPIAQTWHWIEPQRSFNGHAIATPDGLLLTTETDLDTGDGLIGVREHGSLRKIAEWPSHGRDPHELLWDSEGGPPSIIVANGGIATRPETGRVKLDLHRMDSSLVRLSAARGDLVQQLRAKDRRLSMRHIALRDGVIGIALQAGHDRSDERMHAPVLALAEGDTLRVMADPKGLSGYGGAIHATANGFVVSCPRANGLANYATRGEWIGFTPLNEACALAGSGSTLFAGGADHAVRIIKGQLQVLRVSSAVHLDNHWALISV